MSRVVGIALMAACGFLPALAPAQTPLPSQQMVLPTQPDYTVPPSALEEVQTNAMDVFKPTQPGQPYAVPEGIEQSNPIEVGPLTLRPHFFFRSYYADGILAARGDTVDTYINEISPGILLGLGRHFTLDYTPTIRIYGSSRFSDGVDHNVNFAAGAVLSDWELGLGQGYAAISAPLVETGAQTDQEVYSTALTATHQLSARTSVDLGVNQDFRFATGFTDIREWYTLDWLNFQANERTDFGLGLGGGYADVSEGPNTSYERFLGRARWRATERVSLQASVGGEARQFLQGNASDILTPIFTASVQYQPAEATRLSLAASRTVGISYFRAQVIESTGFRAEINQRLFTKTYLTVGGGYSQYSYNNDVATFLPDRQDDYYTADARITYTPVRRLTVSLFYLFAKDNSNDPGFSFTSNQVGLELGYRY